MPDVNHEDPVADLGGRVSSPAENAAAENQAEAQPAAEASAPADMVQSNAEPVAVEEPSDPVPESNIAASAAANADAAPAEAQAPVEAAPASDAPAAEAAPATDAPAAEAAPANDDDPVATE